MKRIIFFSLILIIMLSAFTGLTRSISGMITDDAGNPLIAQILVKGTQKSVTSSSTGSFNIDITSEKTILVISAVGYQTKEIKVGKDSRLSIRLQLLNAPLQELMVTGFVAGKAKALVNASVMSANQLGRGVHQPYTYTTGPTGFVNGRFLRPKPDERIFYGRERFNREGYDAITENQFLSVTDNPLSTFSIDVDAASYSNVRRILKSNRLPGPGAVRIEEMINYFSYEYEQPKGKDPFSVHTELAVCPWNKDHQLALIGLQGKKIDAAALPPSNLTFLIDVSGSMSSENKLPLVKSSLKLLVDQLRPQDNVSIVVYAGNAGLVLPPTEGDRKMAIKEAIDRLESGGSTAGGEGIRLAYDVAKKNFSKTGNNRVILCTDGDFNVGLSSDDALEKLIEEERRSGIYLTVLGYGTGNYQDAKMQKLADKGNGNHAYIDDISEAKKVLINEFGGTLFTIAKDVKLQVEFNPSKVKGYRLIGYENRVLAKEDFNNDKKDAGEMGSGHTVTAIYELIPPGLPLPGHTGIDSLRYQTPLMAVSTTQRDNFSDEVMHIKIRYKQPDSDVSTLVSHPVKGSAVPIERTSSNFRFATAVASFGMLLRNSQYKGNLSFRSIRSLASDAKGEDREGYRKEFIDLVETASRLSRNGELASVEDY